MYEFKFNSSARLEDVKPILDLATFAMEGLYGEASIMMDLKVDIDEDKKVIYIDGVENMDNEMSLIFFNLLAHTIGNGLFTAKRA